MKAAPLLRAWLQRLHASGVRIHLRHRWQGWRNLSASPEEARQSLLFNTPSGEIEIHADAVVLALGGASWAKLGSDGAWAPRLIERGVDVRPFLPSNCGFDIHSPRNPNIGWSAHLAERHAGAPVKPVRLTIQDGAKTLFDRQGECLLTKTGLEGSLIYAASAQLRSRLRDRLKSRSEIGSSASCAVDLLPDFDAARVLREVAHPRGTKSLASHLKSRLGLSGAKTALLYELLTPEELAAPATLAQRIKALPIHLARPRPIDEAISTAGGIALEALDPHLMLRQLPGVFCAGEMLDWEAPTGGYLLTAVMATGRAAGRGLLQVIAPRISHSLT